MGVPLLLLEGENVVGKKHLMYVGALGLGLFLLGVLLYLWYPLAPLLLAVSILIQLPFIFLVSRRSFKKSYLQRLEERKTVYEKTGDAGIWLEQEENEARSIGFRYWSSRGKALNALTRAELLFLLERREDAEQLLKEIQFLKLEKPDLVKYKKLVCQTSGEENTEEATQ